MKIVAGIDIGSITAKTVIMNAAREVVSFSIVEAGIVNETSALKSLKQALEKGKLLQHELQFVVTTGYGRELPGLGDKSITEISCHANGAHFLLPEVRTVIDIGGQDSKAIAVSADGRVKAFSMNDKCAAGTGRFFEVMSRALEIPMSSMEAYYLNSKSPCNITNICTVFAESEIISLASQGYPKEDLIAGLFEAIGRRIQSLLGSIPLQAKIMMSGGVAKNKGMVSALKRLLKMDILVPPEPQIVGALGAALFALKEGVKTPSY